MVTLCIPTQSSGCAYRGKVYMYVSIGMSVRVWSASIRVFEKNYSEKRQFLKRTTVKKGQITQINDQHSSSTSIRIGMYWLSSISDEVLSGKICA